MRLATFQLAVRSILLHKLRSLLTMLGTILGVGSVISMLAIGEGSKQEAIERIRQLGATNVIVRSVKPSDEQPGEDTSNSSSNQETRSHVLDYGLRYKDLEILKSTLPHVRRAVPLTLLRKDAQRGRYRISNARVVGTTPQYLEVKNLSVFRGRFLTDPDLDKMTNVAVLGKGAARRLFAYEDPLEKTVLLGHGAYRVVGVLESHGSGNAMPGAVGQEDFNNDIYIPLTAARSRFGEVQVIRRAGSEEFQRLQLSEITLTVMDERQVSNTASMARRILMRNHPKGNDFEIQVPLELLNQAQRERRVWNLVLGSIAGISLVVGGIGIMNIMLATITERTREIGVRRALGAKQRDITLQFLVETTVLSATGGLLGVFLGIAIPVSIDLAVDIDAAVSWWAVLLAFGMSLVTGVLFGLYPARRAAQMDPIEALRHE